jgi:hypothetical protein
VPITSILLSIFLSITHLIRLPTQHVTNPTVLPSFHCTYTTFLSSLTLRNTCSFFARSVKVIFTVLLHHSIWKNSEGKWLRIQP